jgi:hypothetical protein
LDIPYNFLQGASSRSILPGTSVSTIAGVYSNIGDRYLGEKYPLAEVHMSGRLTSRYTIQLSSIAFGFLSNQDIMMKHMN